LVEIRLVKLYESLNTLSEEETKREFNSTLV
jgi:hypothetical protein